MGSTIGNFNPGAGQAGGGNTAGGASRQPGIQSVNGGELQRVSAMQQQTANAAKGQAINAYNAHA